MSAPTAAELLWYLPNFVESGHRGDTASVAEGHGTLDHQVRLAQAVEDAGWTGALLGTSWGRPDTFTVATALAARTRTFEPLIAVRPGFWHPANFAAAAATLDQLTRGRVRVNIVSGQDDLAAYGDREGSREARYARTQEFMRLVRRLWTEEQVTFAGEHFGVTGSTLTPGPYALPGRPHPKLYFGGASPEAEAVAATDADVQLFWGEPLSGVAERVERLRGLEESLGRELPPLELGLRITTLVRDTREEAWRDAEERVRRMADAAGDLELRRGGRAAVGQRRLLDLAERGDVLDECLYTAPGRYGGGGAATTWLVGSADDVTAALRRYQDLGISHFVLSDTPYEAEAVRVGGALIPRLRGGHAVPSAGTNGVHRS